MGSKVFAYSWEYKVKEAHLDAFEHQYGPNGEWVKFFKKSDDYISTELLRDVNDTQRFVTIDYWTSKEARDRFRKQFKESYERIDKMCDAFTEAEKPIGDFECYREK